MRDGPPHRSLTAEQIDEFREAFGLVATDGRLAKGDLPEVLCALGWAPPDEELRATADAEGTALDFEQFLASDVVAEFLARADDGGGREDELLETFDLFNHDGQGVATAELRSVMQSLGGKWRDEEQNEERNALIEAADEDGDGHLSLEQFRALMLSIDEAGL